MPVGGQHLRETLGTQVLRESANARSSASIDQRIGIHLENHPLGHEISQSLGITHELDAALGVGRE